MTAYGGPVAAAPVRPSSRVSESTVPGGWRLLLPVYLALAVGVSTLTPVRNGWHTVSSGSYVAADNVRRQSKVFEVGELVEVALHRTGLRAGFTGVERRSAAAEIPTVLLG